MHEDEERTLATLTVHRKIVDKLIIAANGQIFNTAGDSVLAEFPSVSRPITALSPSSGLWRRLMPKFPKPTEWKCGLESMSAT